MTQPPTTDNAMALANRGWALKEIHDLPIEVMGWINEAATALRALPAANTAGDVRKLLDRNRRYLDAFDGRNELYCGPHMLNHALVESTELIERLSALSSAPAGGTGEALVALRNKIEQRMHGFASRSTAIFNGSIVAEELADIVNDLAALSQQAPATEPKP